MIYKKLSVFCERKLFIIYFFIAFLKSFFFSNIKIYFISLRNGILPYRKKIIQSKKQSDTLFIFGGGETINEITEEQWKIIKNSDSLGINRWLYHSHVPTYMMIEGAKKKDLPFIKEVQESIYKTWQDSNSRYKNTLILIKDLDALLIDFEKIKLFKNRMYSMLKLIPPGKTLKGLAKSFSIINRIKLLQNVCFPPGSRGSITHATSFGVLSGYKNIILCGIDLCGGYYWDSCKPELLFAEVPTFLPVDKEKRKKFKVNLSTHETMIPENSEVTIDQVLLNISKFLNKDQKIYVNSANSLLSKHFPVYW